MDVLRIDIKEKDPQLVSHEIVDYSGATTFPAPGSWPAEHAQVSGSGNDFARLGIEEEGQFELKDVGFG